MDYELAIIGAGPAGYAASIYAGRSGIKAVTFDKMGGGGLAMISPNIENYPGFASVTGAELMDKMQQQAKQYADIHFLETVNTISKNKETFTIETSTKSYSVNAVLLCMGTEYRQLNVPGEKELQGKGVSYCATCDGMFFKDKTVAVVGGGNTAVIEAIFLQQLGCKEVFLIHRRDQLRAEKIYEKEAMEKGVNILYNSHVEQIKGTDHVESLEIHDTASDKQYFKPVDGVFISIGEEPQNKLAMQLGVNLDDKGFILVDKQQRTNVKGVYAAGDITGGLRQIVTACAEGALAALSSTEVLGKQYPY